MRPIISIITPTFNRADTIGTSIRSVFNQGINDIEYIIMDGGSSDNTREIVSNYPSVKYFSEPDNGLYFAVNKGIRLAKGKYIGWLNSDDYFPEGALKAAIAALTENPSWTAVFGNAEVYSLEKKQLPILIPGFQQVNFPQKISSESFSINAGFFKRDIFEKLEFFDTSYKIASDRDFMFRFMMSDYPFGTLDQTLYIYQMSSTSLTFSKNLNGKIRGEIEEMQIANKYLEKISNNDIKNICINWILRTSADASFRSVLIGDQISAKNFKIKGQVIDRVGWQKAYIRTVLMYFARKIFPPNFRVYFRKFKKYLGYYSDYHD